MKRIAIIGIFAAVAGVGAGLGAWVQRRPGRDITSRALTPRVVSSAATTTRFHELTADECGVAFVNRLEARHNVPFLNNGAGVAIGDYDADGLPDLYLTSIDGPNALYRQSAPWRFTDVTASAGVDGGAAWSRGATFADIDNDGDLDLYVCATEAPNRLYINNGDGAFSERAADFGVDLVAASIMGSFADYDRDGDVDLYVVTYRALSIVVPDPLLADVRPPADTRTPVQAMRPRPPRPRADGTLEPADRRNWLQVGPRYEMAGQPDALLRNNGDGTFTNVTEAAGVADAGLGLSTLWLDFDEDGWLDLYVANDLVTPDRLYRNNRDGTFTETLQSVLPQTPWFSMGSDFGDVDNDGHFDFLVADMSATTHERAKVMMGDMSNYRWFLTHEWPRQVMRNALYLGTGAGRYLEAAFLAGLASTDWTWAVKLEDLDNDGRIDAFFSNGTARDDMNPDLIQIRAAEIEHTQGKAAVYDFLRQIPAVPDANLAFRNLGDLRFDNVSVDWGLAGAGVSYGAALGDLDRDGDLDLVVSNLNEPASLYRNDTATGHAVLLELRGTHSNRAGFGATIHATTRSQVLVRRLLPARGYMSSDEPLVHFGLGSAETLLALRVEWPSGHVQTFTDLAADRLYTLHEPDAPPPQAPSEPIRPSTTPAGPSFHEEAAAIGLDFVHRERDFDDYADQPLLPGKLSQLGPGLAASDVNADGIDDVFVGGAAGQAAQLFLSTAPGRFEASAWQRDSEFEDLGVLFLDADGDDDLDLYVGSGGVECKAGSALLRDRLYWNDGHGRFTAAAGGILPELFESTSVVAASDFDADGDLDLFVGARVIPGRYAHTPRSALLRNDRGRFTDVTAQVAPEMARAGLVTAALWSDADTDGWLDLLVAGEWSALRLFHNEHGRFVERTHAAGLASRSGWWNAIAGGDWDDDGDIDYMALNVGLNTKYRAPDPDHPVMLFAGNLDGSGKHQLVEAKSSASSTLLPIRGRSCSSAAMPFVAERFSTYGAFAAATLHEIYGAQTLARATQLVATELQSCLLRNDGHGGFSWRDLPRRAQLSPGYGSVVADFDADGCLDVFVAQNLFTREPETGPWRGGLGALLTGTNAGDFRFAEVARHGVIVAGDGKGAVVTDWNQDGWPDLLVAQNNDRLLAFRNAANPGRTALAVRLHGPRGNPTGVGARVEVASKGVLIHNIEVYAGSGYLSQSSPTQFVGCDIHDAALELRVHWPDGSKSTQTVHPADLAHQPLVTISHPSRERS